MSEPEGEVERVGFAPRSLLEGSEGGAEDAAVDFDPAVAEEDQRRPLRKQEA